MLIVAIWHLTAFKHTEFASVGPDRTKWWPSLLISFNMVDMAKDIYHSFFTINMNFPNIWALRKEDPSLVSPNSSHTTIELQEKSSDQTARETPETRETETDDSETHPRPNGDFAAIVL